MPPIKDLEKRREYQREWYRKRFSSDEEFANKVRAQARARSLKIKTWLREYKLASGCVDCGYKEHWVALDFDHTDGKSINLSFAKSITQAKKEIDKHKCEVRCSNCHRIKTWERLNV